MKHYLLAVAVLLVCGDAQSSAQRDLVEGQCGGSSPNWTAISPSEKVVASCLKLLHAGDTLTIGSGTALWTKTLNWTAPPNVTIKGNTVCTGSGNPAYNNLACTDNTIIVDRVPRTGTNGPPILSIVLSGTTTDSFRMTGLSFLQDGSTIATTNFSIYIYGTSHLFRMDHNHIYTPWGSNVEITLGGWLEGVVDHNIIVAPLDDTNNAIQVYHDAWGGLQFGDGSWSDDPKFSSSEFMFFEDNFYQGSFADDLGIGGRAVWRFNTFDRSEIQGHNGADRNRSTREWQIYGNSAACDPTLFIGGCGASFMYTRGGSGFTWGNTVTNVSGFLQLVLDRTDGQTLFPAPPLGWGYCGTAEGFGRTGDPFGTHGPSSWDGNTDTTGYPCLDQPGRGKGDAFPNSYWPVTPFWPHQQSEPVYEWLDNVTVAPTWPLYFMTADTSVIQNNRDYYYCTSGGGNPGTGSCSDFTGATGVGSGLYASRPMTCTQGTAYWATDQGGNWNKTTTSANNGELFVCDGSNTFQPYYRPYTYPHPLTDGSHGPGG